jgi:hypothetical protein
MIPPPFEPPPRRARRLGRGLALVALVAGFAGAGCGQSFAPFNRLTGLRVLAVRSGAQAGEPVAPAMGESTTIDALVYVPDGTAPTYQWSWCPFEGNPNDGYQCPVTEAQVSALAGVPVSFNLGTDATASFTNSFDPTVLETLCAGAPGFPVAPDCSLGFPIGLKVTVAGDNDTVTAVRPLHLRFRADQDPNANPTIGALFATIDGGTQAIDAGGTAVLPRRKDTAIGTTIPTTASESYHGKDNNGDPALVNERLTVDWFVQTGDTDHQRTSFIAGQVPLSDTEANKWQPAIHKDYPHDEAELILVIRDDREGVAWTSGFAHLEATP